MATKKAPAAALVLVLTLSVAWATLAIGQGTPRAAGEPPLLGPFKDNFTLLQPPRPAPRAAFTNGAGQPQTLQDFAGQVILLNFWATWCGPCIPEMPDFDHLQAAFGGQDFVVIAASQDRGGAPVVEQFYQEHGLDALGIYLDGSGKLSREIGVRGLPTTFLIDDTGQIVGAFEGPAEWDSPEAKALILHYLTKGDGGSGPEVLKTSG